MLATCLVVAGLALGQTPPASPPAAGEKAPATGSAAAAADAAKVRRLVAQLDDSGLAQRAAAEKELLEMGPGVLDHLPQVTDRMAAEVKERLRRVRKTLETQAVEAATKATRVTLSGEMEFSAALELLAAQTGNKIAGYEGNSASVATDFADAPFWPAFDQLLDRAGLSVNVYGGQDNTLVLTGRPDGEGDRSARAAYSEIFRFEIVRAVAVNDLRNPALNGLRLTMEVSWEPRLTPISLEQPLDALAATDESGRSLALDNQVGVLGAAVQSGVSALELEIPFSSPDKSAQRIASLKGTLTATLPGRVETFEFPNVGKAREIEQQKAGVRVAVEQVRKNGDLYELRMRVQFDEAANALESHQGWIYGNEAYLLSPGGERIPYAALEATRQEENEVGLAYLFDVEGGPGGHTFVYKTPAGIIRRSVPYELKEIELP